MNLNKDIIKEIVDISKKYDGIKKVVLFGSRARGDNELKSDIDYLIQTYGEDYENNIDDKIVFDVKNKGEYCQNNCIDIMIEDDPNNLRKLIGKTNIIIFDYPYNRNFEFDNITRAYSWYDIYYKIRNIKEYKNDISNN